GHKGARLTSQISLPGRYLVLVPGNSMTGISRKLPDTERARLKKILKEVVPEGAGVIVRTAAEGASEAELRADVERLTGMWQRIESKQKSANAPALVHGEPDMTVRVIRDVFNEDFAKVVVSGDQAWSEVSEYINDVAPDLADRVEKWTGTKDVFTHYRVTEALAKAMDRKVWLPSGGSLVIDRTEAMTVVDVNTGKFVGSGGNLEETVTKNNIEAAEEIVRQLRLRDIGGIIVVDFIDMVLESNRDLVLRRLVECLGRDRTKHQVAEVTSLGLVQMTRKKLGLGLLESFSEPCETCAGRGIIIHHDPVTKHRQSAQPEPRRGRGNRSGGNGGDSPRNNSNNSESAKSSAGTHAITEDVKNALAKIAASTIVPTETGSIPTVSASTDAAADDVAAKVRKASEPVKSGVVTGGRGRGKQSNAGSDSSTEAADAEAPASPDEKVAAAEAVVEILDIPLKKSARSTRRISTKDAEDILGSVLEALPEPKQPGQGRGRVSRRASSAGIVTAEEK